MMNSISSVGSVARTLEAEGVAFAPQIADAAAKHGLDPRLLAAVAAQETGGPGSNGGRNVIGDGGHGRGVFQIDDRFHDFARTAAAMDPAANADYAAGMLKGLLERYGGNVRAALSAYNAGDPHAEGTSTVWSDGSRLGYADSVLRHYAQLESPANESLADSLTAESPDEQADVNALSAFAALQGFAPIQPYDPSQQPSYSYRQIAGLDENGHVKDGDDFGSLLDVGGDGNDDGP